MTYQITSHHSHQQNKLLLALILALILLLLLIFTHDADASVWISYTPCAEPGGEIVFTFSQPMVKDADLNTAGHPDVIFEPEQRGAFAWRSPTELVFTPAKGSFGWGERIRMTIEQAVPLAGEAEALQYAWSEEMVVSYIGKVADWPMVKGQPRFVSFLDWHTNQIGRGPVFLLYDQPVSAVEIKKALQVTFFGEPLPTKVYHPKIATKQVTDKKVNPDYVIAVELVEFPKDAETIEFRVPDWQNGELTLQDYALTVNTNFRLVHHRPENYWDEREKERLSLHTALSLIFNNAFEIERLQEALRIEPQPETVHITQETIDCYSVNWEQEDDACEERRWYAVARVELQLKPGTTYRMFTDGWFTDILGNPIARPVDIAFTSKDLPPVLALPATPVILENDKSRLPLQARNLRNLTAKLHRFSSAEAFADALEIGRKSDVSEYDLQSVETITLSQTALAPNEKMLLDAAFKGKSGLFAVEISASGTGSEATGEMSDAVLVQRTDLAVTSKIFADSVFVWVTRLHDAAPVQGATVKLYAGGNESGSSGVTAADGTITLAASGLASGTGLKRNLSIIAEKEGDIAVSRLIDSELSQPWQFGLKGEVEGFALLPAAIFTDRGAYRPGETVHLNVIVGKNIAQAAEKVELEIRDPRGQQAAKQTLDVDRFGSATFDLHTKEAGAVGEYLAQVSVGAYMATQTFRVEEYRVPSFQVKVKTEQDAWKRGEDASAVIAANYLHGGKLGGREVKWDVLRQPVPFAPAAFPRYVFTLGDPASLAGNLVSGTDKLNGEGEFVVNFRADHPSSAGQMRYIVEASVTDVDRQNYAGRLINIVHPAAFYIGVLPPSRAILPAGEKLSVPVIAVQPDGMPREQVKTTVEFELVEQHTTTRMNENGGTQMFNRPVYVEKQRCDITTRQTAVNCEFAMPEAGVYQVRAIAEDADHQVVQTGFRIVATGDNPAAWPRFDVERIELTADKPEYHVGDIARLVAQTPYKTAQGLLTIERDGVLEHRLFTIDKNTPALEVPITAEFTPNVFVSVILVRGRIHDKKDASGFETGAPGFKIGYARLNVVPAERRLTVNVTPSNAVSNPGQPVKITLNVRDFQGKPAAGQATVMVVDEAVLGLTAYQTPDPIPAMYAERPLGVRTGASYLDLPHARRARLETIFPGGDKDDTALLFNDPNVLRKLFNSTAYWNPDVPVAADGTATVEFTLPDNLTTYRVMAVVSDEERRAGSGDNRILVKKSLMIQPALPRFAYPDDELTLEALVFNGTAAANDAHLVAEFDGLALQSGDAAQTLNVAADGSQSFKFPVKVSGKKQAVIRFAAKLGEHADAVEVNIPILEPGTRRQIVVSKSVTGADNVSVEIPAERIPGSVKLEIVTSTTALSELKDSVQYLMGYPNGCIEQTTSTAYPLVVLRDLLPEIGVEVSEADLKKFSEAGVKRILSFQTPAGGLSYWPGGTEPHAFATAFGLTALIEAKKRGYDVPDQALAGMADYLEEALRRGDITESIPHGGMADADTRALFLMTLGRLGRPQPGYISMLWEKRDKLTPFGLAFLAIAVKELPNDHSLLEPILAEVRKAAQEEEKEAYFDGKAKGGWSFDSPLRTHGASLLAFAEAHSGDMTGKLLTGLLKRRNGGLWGNTQENVFGIMAIHAVVTAQSGDQNAPVMELTRNSEPVDIAAMQESSRQVRRLALVESDLKLENGKANTQKVSLKNNGGTPIFLTVRMQYDVPLTPENMQAQSQGFTITRHYETLEGASLDGQPIPLGSLVRVRVNVKTDGEYHYVAIDDKLPAGFEPLNTELKTTQTVEQGELSAALQRGASVLSYKEIRDSRVAFYVDEMLPSEYEFAYIARATTPGVFLRPAGRVEAMYQTENFGVTSIDTVTIR